MRRISTISLVLLTLLLTGILPAGFAYADAQNGKGTTEEIKGPTNIERPLYGPILSKDPATRVKIKNLYIERNALEQSTVTRLEGLNRAYADETDTDFRWELANEMSELKRYQEIHNIEIGIELAHLNGQQQRAAEFELALDQVLNPEKYFPDNRPDPALKAARLREHGLK